MSRRPDGGAPGAGERPRAGAVESGPGWELRLADCLDPYGGLASLANSSVDHILTDPPYDSATHRSSVTLRAGPRRGLAPIPFAPMVEYDAVAAQLARVARRWIAVFSADRNLGAWINALEGAGLEYVRTLIWRKEGCAPQFTGDRPAAGAEFVALAHRRGRKRWNGGGRANVYTAGVPHGPDRHGHPTAKPLALMQAIVRDFANPAELICDPFVGSGSTGVACLMTGRRFIGWERDDGYYAIAASRLRAAREQTELFAAGGAR